MKYMSNSEQDIFEMRNSIIAELKEIMEPEGSLDHHIEVLESRNTLDEDECTLIYKIIFSTIGKISLHEFTNSFHEMLGIEMDIEGLKLVLSRINHKVSILKSLDL
jgi:hypothetical protein